MTFYQQSKVTTSQVHSDQQSKIRTFASCIGHLSDIETVVECLEHSSYVHKREPNYNKATSNANLGPFYP